MRKNRRTLLTFARIFVVCVAIFRPARAAETWLCARTDNLRIISDIPQKDLVDFALRYSAFRFAFDQLLAPSGRSAPASTVVLFKRASVFKQYAPTTKVIDANTVFFNAVIDGHALVGLLYDGNRDEPFSRAFQFETTFGLQRLGVDLPIWALQGAGEVFSTLQLKKGRCVVGGYDEIFNSITNDEPWIPWPRFFDITPESSEYRSRRDNATFLFQSWALMHRILIEEGQTRSNFAKLSEANRSAAGENLQKTVENLLGVPAKDFRNILIRHLAGTQTIELPFDAATAVAKIRVTPLSEGEIHIQFAELLEAAGNETASDAEFQRAAVESPNSPEVKESFARRELRADNKQQALFYYRAAIEAGSTNSQVYTTSAKEWLAESSENAPKAMKELRKAIQLDPDNMEAYEVLSRAIYVSSNPTDDDMVLLSQFIDREPRSLMVRYYRALIYERMDKRSEMISDLKTIMSDSRSSDSIRRLAGDRMAYIIFAEDEKRINELVRDEQFDQASDIITNAVHAQGGNAAAAQYRALVPMIIEKRQFKRLKSLDAKGEWAQLKAACTSFLRDFPKSSSNREVKRLYLIASEALQAEVKPPTP